MDLILYYYEGPLFDLFDVYHENLTLHQQKSSQAKIHCGLPDHKLTTVLPNELSNMKLLAQNLESRHLPSWEHKQNILTPQDLVYFHQIALRQCPELQRRDMAFRTWLATEFKISETNSLTFFRKLDKVASEANSTFRSAWLMFLIHVLMSLYVCLMNEHGFGPLLQEISYHVLISGLEYSAILFHRTHPKILIQKICRTMETGILQHFSLTPTQENLFKKYAETLKIQCYQLNLSFLYTKKDRIKVRRSARIILHPIK